MAMRLTLVVLLLLSAAWAGSKEKKEKISIQILDSTSAAVVSGHVAGTNAYASTSCGSSGSTNINDGHGCRKRNNERLGQRQHEYVDELPDRVPRRDTWPRYVHHQCCDVREHPVAKARCLAVVRCRMAAMRSSFSGNLRCRD